MTKTLLALGLGYSAQRFLALHRDRFGHVVATASNPDKRDRLRAQGIEAHLLAPGEELRQAVSRATHVIASIPPGPDGDPALRLLGDALSHNDRLEWAAYLSTTGVYGDHGGSWIDESTPVTPQSERTRRRAAAEVAWRALGAAMDRPVQVFRLSGIYGPGRNALLDLKDGSARRIVKPGQVFNRIHVADIATALGAAMQQPHAGPVFNLADDEPAPSADVVAFAATLAGVPVPPAVPFEEANLSEMGLSFWAENKRVSNALLKSDLGLTLAYPTYREGLTALWEAGEGR